MNPKQFLQVGGVVLAVLGLLGFFGLIGPTADQSIFGSAWWFDNGENWAHIILGVIGFVAAFAFPSTVQKPLVILLGALGVLVGLYSLFISEIFLGTTLQNPADTILHIVVGAWALWAGLGKRGTIAEGAPKAGM
ncbi:hypothetical protein C4571_02370 [Candidatus Parcubacteria bacterium]|nr:MAG: hypothetical protein C4571_02370 [Candidatus Parcubacteria bacterium]